MKGINGTWRAAACALACAGAFAAPAFAQSPTSAKQILFLAGPRDHGFPGRHEYERDLRTLAAAFEKSSNVSGVTTRVIVGSLPRDPALLEGVSAIVIDSSSDRHEKETHPLFPPNPTTNGRGYDAETAAWLKSLDATLREKKIGVVLLHYASWAENWTARAYYLNWTGGLWVQGVSKNPVDEWAMSLTSRKHPILRGVKPWTYRDEVFCRYFLPNDARRTNLLLATPKEDKLKIGAQIASFAYEREDGGRGFVFGGLDFRDNLALDNYRRFLLNGIGWAAGIEIPKAGIESPTPDVSDTSPRSPPLTPAAPAPAPVQPN